MDSLQGFCIRLHQFWPCALYNQLAEYIWQYNAKKSGNIFLCVLNISLFFWLLSSNSKNWLCLQNRPKKMLALCRPLLHLRSHRRKPPWSRKTQKERWAQSQTRRTPARRKETRILTAMLRCQSILVETATAMERAQMSKNSRTSWHGTTIEGTSGSPEEKCSA